MSLVESLKLRALRAGAGLLAGYERVTRGATYNPLSRAALANPYPMYRRLRERDPVHPSRLIGGGFVLSRYDDVIDVLRDARFSADERNFKRYEQERQRRIDAGLFSEDEPYNPSMLRLDAPDHTRLRGLVSKAFTPRAIEVLRPRIEQIVTELLDEAAEAGELDVISDLGYPLPVMVIAEMLGIPTEDRAQFKHWSDEVVRGLGFTGLEDERRSQAASRQLGAYLAEIIEKRRVEPRDDLISRLVQAEEQGDKLSTEEVYATVQLLLVAGNETTTNLIGNGTLALLRNPEALEALRREPSLIQDGIDELLRYDSPVQATQRIAREDVVLPDGALLPKGEQVVVLLGSGNRDPDAFSDPDRLDFARSETRHLSFGLGTHFCLGSQLARLEGRVAIGALVERFPDLSLPSRPLRWGDNSILRGLKTLPVTV